MQKNGKAAFTVAAAAIFLALTYFCIGYAVAAGVPQTTSIIAKSTVDDSDSPFDKSQLVQGAEATREYSFVSHDVDAFYDVIASMNDAAGTPYAGVSRDELQSAPEQYTVGPEALAHLDDVFSVSERLFVPMLSVCAMAAFLLMMGLYMFGVKVVAESLVWGGVVTLGMMAVLGIWALVSFESLFAAMHSLFFAGDSWLFSADSLLITMLPQGFWVGMAGAWLVTSVVMSAASIAAGLYVLKRKPKKITPESVYIIGEIEDDPDEGPAVVRQDS